MVRTRLLFHVIVAVLLIDLVMVVVDDSLATAIGLAVLYACGVLIYELIWWSEQEPEDARGFPAPPPREEGRRRWLDDR
ncbi:MAG: hypothetical protein M3N52_00110 [Actinomycetota bacterium]|nr:hypothetical protein [Actinomycetota bacterium]